ncbi:hypothetical protein CLV47_109105 [Antricoccus suffuscus]|uniref:Uncharacterized protein n=1 Tax=Antricoccus suffuscus TaxID=1629062 RepID=A0A2T0ZZN7_9ACTN|nr:hypothetical protein [Antricoccus suffuscus]PRZ41558.1 hypothetical protein CLV47_109105 [Antricoccus suffuscus]
MTTLAPQRTVRSARQLAVLAMYVGLALSAAAAAVVIIDQATSDTLWRHMIATYSVDYNHVEMADSKSILLTYLLSIAVIGIACWLWMAWAVTKGKRWARAVSTLIFVLAACIALFNLVGSEDGYGRLLPTLYGLVGVLPSVAGLVAVILLWRRGTSDDHDLRIRPSTGTSRVNVAP